MKESTGERHREIIRVVITKAGKPYLEARKPGRLKGKIRMPADFDRTPEDIIEGFEGRL
ncbi:hypothetical protein [Pseudomonas sp. A25(2017)]|uniref:hypothetical protein n=1 Tax=Pseudomonas sp. A25(2017) TaxID=1945865 RepID=UPI00143D50AD|nr:hypothetical protein [Pseudomonas sp. A25(2017)]